MSLKDIDKRIKDFEEIEEEEEKREPFETLNDFKKGDITGEEALAILSDNEEPFSNMQEVIIKSALLSDKEKVIK